MFTGQNNRKKIYTFIISSLVLGIVGGYFLAAPQRSDLKKEMLILNSTLQEEKLKILYMNETIIQQENDISENLYAIEELEKSLADAEELIANQSELILNFDTIISELNTRDSLYIVNNGIEIIEINLKTGDIIATYIIPHLIDDVFHAAWPSGIVYFDDFFWLAAADSDEILKLDPNDMSIVAIYNSPGPRPNGLAWDGEFLWCVDNGGMLFKLDHDTLRVVEYFPLSYREPTGLTWDGNDLWVYNADYQSGNTMLHSLDPVTGNQEATRNLSIPKHAQFVGLAWEEDYLWLSFSTTDSESHTQIGEIYKYYPRTGILIKQYNLPPDSNIYAGLTLAPSSNYWVWDDN